MKVRKRPFFGCPRAAFSAALPAGAGTAAEFSSSRPACVTATASAPPRRARATTLREVSRRYVAAHCGVSSRGRQSEFPMSSILHALVCPSDF